MGSFPETYNDPNFRPIGNSRVFWMFRSAHGTTLRLDQTFHETNETYWVKFMKRSTSGSVKFIWMSLDRPTRSIRLLQTERTSEDRLQDKRRSSSLRGRRSKGRERELGRETTREGGGGRGQRHNKKMLLHNFYPTLHYCTLNWFFRVKGQKNWNM